MAIAMVELTTQTTVPQGYQIDGALGVCYQVIHKVHRLWRWYRFSEVYTNPDNFLSLVAGHGLSWLGGGNNTVVNVAAQVVLIAARITECIEEQVNVVNESKFLWDDLTDSHTLCQKVKWKDAVGESGWLSPSTEIWLKETYVWLVDRIVRVAKRLFAIGKSLFRLSMKTLDAAESFSYGNNQNERVSQLFVNSRKCLKTLVENKELLLNGVEKYRGVIKQILGHTDSMITDDQLVAMIKKSLGVMESVHNGVNTASEAFGEFGVDLAKRAAFGLFQAAGLLDLMPISWTPPRNPPWVERRMQQERKAPFRFLPMDDVSFQLTYEKLVNNEVHKEVRKIKRPKSGVKDSGYRVQCKDVEVKTRKRYAQLCRMPITKCRVVV